MRYLVRAACRINGREVQPGDLLTDEEVGPGIAHLIPPRGVYLEPYREQENPHAEDERREPEDEPGHRAGDEPAVRGSGRSGGGKPGHAA